MRRLLSFKACSNAVLDILAVALRVASECSAPLCSAPLPASQHSMDITRFLAGRSLLRPKDFLLGASSHSLKLDSLGSTSMPLQLSLVGKELPVHDSAGKAQTKATALPNDLVQRASGLKPSNQPEPPQRSSTLRGVLRGTGGLLPEAMPRLSSQANLQRRSHMKAPTD